MRLYIAIVFLLCLSGCGPSYVTPGGSVDISGISDVDIKTVMSIKPAATFPAHIAMVRVQASGYQSWRTDSYGTGRYSVVTTRDAEDEEGFARLAAMPQVAGLGSLNRLLLPAQLDSIKTLREAAARLKADILLIYTFDTSLHVGEEKFAPLNVISLGFLNNKEVTVTTTVSAAFFDVRTEYLFGIAEASARQSRHSSTWSTSEAINDLRLLTEQAAFKKIVPELEKTWGNIVHQYAQQAAKD